MSTIAATRFSKTVPMPTTPAMGRSPVEFVKALLASRTLRTAVEQIRDRAHDAPVYRDGFYFTTLRACINDDGTTTPGSEFVTGKTWSMDDEKAVRRRVYKALTAWGFLVDEMVVSDGPCSVARAWFALSSEEAVAIALMLVGVTGSASKALDHAAWRWLGYSRREVSLAMYYAQSRGLCECYESGYVVDLRFRDANGALYYAV